MQTVALMPLLLQRQMLLLLQRQMLPRKLLRAVLQSLWMVLLLFASLLLLRQRGLLRPLLGLQLDLLFLQPLVRLLLLGRHKAFLLL